MMKKFLLILILGTVVILPQSLRQVTASSYNSLSGVFFLDENDGYASGSYESIYRTTDGGNTWTLLHEDLDGYSLQSIQFLDALTGYTGGGISSAAKLLKTTDGGVSWNEVTSPGSATIQKLFFTDASTGWVLLSTSNAADIMKTTDGGNSWTNVMSHSPGDMEDMYMLPAGNGVAVGGGVGKIDIYYTSDGNTWTKAPAPTIPPGVTYTRSDIRSVYMVNENLAYTCGWGSSAAGLQPNLFLKSTDGGASWTYLEQLPENRIYSNLYSIRFKDELNGLAFGGGATEGTVIAKTTDGGTNWIPITSGAGFTAQRGFNLGDKVWVVGNSSGIIYSENFGESWQQKTPIVGGTLNDIVAVNNSIIAGGFNGVIVRSIDNGVTWGSNYAAVDMICNTINGLHFINESTGFAARNNRLVCKTTDAGISWTKILSDTSATGFTNESVFFFDENTGFVAGRAGSNSDIIYKTTNSGSNWTTVNNIVNENLNDVEFGTANNGAAVANDSKILYTTDGGTVWQAAQFIDLPSGLEVDINRLTFTSTTKGVAVGQNCIFTTDDAGATWKYIVVNNLDRELEGVAFKNENEGWAVGYQLILYTTDGGKTWTDIADTLVLGSNRLYSAAVDANGNLWIGGSESSVFTNAPLVSIDTESPSPSEYGLDQNFPNPFNPETVIKYRLGTESDVTIKVYDMLGSIVKVLVSKKLTAGEYSVSFNATGLSSGIYFCVMKADDYLAARKMIVIK